MRSVASLKNASEFLLLEKNSVCPKSLPKKSDIFEDFSMVPLCCFAKNRHFGHYLNNCFSLPFCLALDKRSVTEASTSICSLGENDFPSFWLSLSCEGFEGFGDLLTHIPLKGLCLGRGQRLSHPGKASFHRFLQSTDLSACHVCIVLTGVNYNLP